MLVVVDQRGDLTVGGAVRPAIGRHRARDTPPGPAGVEHRAVGVLDEHERGHRLEHRDFDLLALAGAFAVEERHHGGVQGGQSGDLVRHDGADVVGLAGQLFLDRGDAAFGLDGVVVGRTVRSGPR